MTPERMHSHLQELEAIVAKGFTLRHHPTNPFELSIIYDAIYLIRLYRKLIQSSKNERFASWPLPHFEGRFLPNRSAGPVTRYIPFH